MTIHVDFTLESACSSPYVSAPSSPPPFFPGDNYFYTAPPSPARISATSSTTFSSFHALIDDDHDDNPPDFAFDFSGHLDTPTTLSADQLFYAGVIKPALQLPPQQPPEKGRFSEVTTNKNKSSSARQHKSTSSRPLSPLRVSDILLDGSKESSSTAWYSRWSFMFRSKSEGSASTMKKKKWVVEKSESETDSKKNIAMSRRRKQGMSSHELHYTTNRAASEEMRKKTSLPYKGVQHHGIGWLGCLGFGPPNFDTTSLQHGRHSSYYISSPSTN